MEDRWWFSQPFVIREGEQRLHRPMDFTDSSVRYEVGLLEAHVDYKSSNELFQMKIEDPTLGTHLIRLPQHMVRTADDFVAAFGMSSFIDGGKFTPVTNILQVTKLTEDKVKVAITDTSYLMDVKRDNEYTKQFIGGGDANLNSSQMSHVFDVSKMRDVITDVEVQMPGFVEEDVLDVVPLEPETYNIHYVPKHVVYKPVSPSVFTSLQSHFKFRCADGDHHGQCTNLQQATLILHVRPVIEEEEDESCTWQ